MALDRGLEREMDLWAIGFGQGEFSEPAGLAGATSHYARRVARRHGVWRDVLGDDGPCAQN